MLLIWVLSSFSAPVWVMDGQKQNQWKKWWLSEPMTWLQAHVSAVMREKIWLWFHFNVSRAHDWHCACLGFASAYFGVARAYDLALGSFKYCKNPYAWVLVFPEPVIQPWDHLSLVRAHQALDAFQYSIKGSLGSGQGSFQCECYQQDSDKAKIVDILCFQSIKLVKKVTLWRC